MDETCARENASIVMQDIRRPQTPLVGQGFFLDVPSSIRKGLSDYDREQQALIAPVRVLSIRHVAGAFCRSEMRATIVNRYPS